MDDNQFISIQFESVVSHCGILKDFVRTIKSNPQPPYPFFDLHYVLQRGIFACCDDAVAHNNISPHKTE